MSRAFKHTDGKTWTASENGTYSSNLTAVYPGERAESTLADLDFTCEDGRHAYGTMARGYVERASEEHLREALQEALDTAAQ